MPESGLYLTLLEVLLVLIGMFLMARRHIMNTCIFSALFGSLASFQPQFPVQF